MGSRRASTISSLRTPANRVRSATPAAQPIDAESWVLLFRSLLFACVVLFIVPFAGCGGRSATPPAVTGKIVKNGSPLTVQGQQIGVGRIELHFLPMFAGGTSRVVLVRA